MDSLQIYDPLGLGPSREAPFHEGISEPSSLYAALSLQTPAEICTPVARDGGGTVGADTVPRRSTADNPRNRGSSNCRWPKRHLYSFRFRLTSLLRVDEHLSREPPRPRQCRSDMVYAETCLSPSLCLPLSLSHFLSSSLLFAGVTVRDYSESVK